MIIIEIQKRKDCKKSFVSLLLHFLKTFVGAFIKKEMEF